MYYSRYYLYLEILYYLYSYFSYLDKDYNIECSYL